MKAPAQESSRASFRAAFTRRVVLTVVALLTAGNAVELAQNSVLRLDPQHTTINFTLGDVLHTVRGSFKLERGELHFDRSANKLSGEIVVDAKSGNSGNGMRDRKMHRELLESDRYPEIIFRPSRVDGNVPVQGKASVRIHGIFSIHGSDHELLVPAEVDMSPDHWTATLHFAVPYVNWGIKNPSTFFLRVSESVDIDLTTGGSVSR
ncbi:MAG: YceI family protein [Candidatus Sulfotelmatobacter sp.]